MSNKPNKTKAQIAEQIGLPIKPIATNKPRPIKRKKKNKKKK
jgi:hypothetical protein